MMLLKNLYYSYKDTLIFSNFSLNTEEGKNILVIHGPSGSGKTTLLKIIFGLYKPDKIDDIHKYQNIGLILQEDSLAPWLTGLENIVKFINVPISELENHQLYGVVYGFIHKKACHMSYEQRRMVELFRMLLSKNELILLDEPFNFINKDNRVQILNFLKKENRQFIITTHFDDGLVLENSELLVFEGEAPYSELRKYNKHTV